MIKHGVAHAILEKSIKDGQLDYESFIDELEQDDPLPVLNRRLCSRDIKNDENASNSYCLQDAHWLSFVDHLSCYDISRTI